MEQLGVGEVIIQSIDKVGTYKGYDIELIKFISQTVIIPVDRLSGAANYNYFNLAVKEGYASAVAAGSMFVYHDPHKADLISFPNKQEIKNSYN